MEELVRDPSFEEAERIIKEYVSRRYTLQVNGLCSVNYQGRAKSKLDRGERIVIVKQDSALLVHGPQNYQPKNWQPEVDSFDVRIEEVDAEGGDGARDSELVLTAFRKSPDEKVEIRFERIDLVSVAKLIDKSDLEIRGHEVDIHESIEESPELVEGGLKIIEREKETPAGFIDVFARDEKNNYVVIEVKRNPDYNTVLQLQRYVDEIEKEYRGEVRGILVAPKMTSKVLDYLEDRGLEFVEVAMEDVIASYESLDRSQSGLSDFSPGYEVDQS